MLAQVDLQNLRQGLACSHLTSIDLSLPYGRLPAHQHVRSICREVGVIILCESRLAYRLWQEHSQTDIVTSQAILPLIHGSAGLVDLQLRNWHLRDDVLPSIAATKHTSTLTSLDLSGELLLVLKPLVTVCFNCLALQLWPEPASKQESCQSSPIHLH